MRTRSVRRTLTAALAIVAFPTAAAAQTENFTLTQQVRQLDEVIVSGVSEATSARNLTISVGKVGEQQLKDVPPKDAVSALAGKVSGVRVQQTQGLPGSTPAIRVRTS